MSQTYDNNGLQYIFAHSKCGNSWTIAPHRFQITNSKTQLAQFITSNWYSNLVSRNGEVHYLIIGIKGSFKYSEIKSTIDRSCGHDITLDEKNLNIIFKDKFCLENKAIKNYIKDNTNSKTSFDIHLYGMIGNTNLLLRGRYLQKSLYLTLPEFIINVESNIEK